MANAVTSKPRYRVRASSYRFMSGSSPLHPYDAATTGRRALPESDAGPSSAVVNAGASLVSKSRKLVANNGAAKQIIRTLTSDIIGTGIKPQSQDPELQRLWKRWARQTRHYDVQSLATRSMLEGGDCLARFRIRRPEDGLTVPLDIQLIESEQLPHSKSETWGQNRIIAGVEVGPLGPRRPEAYHILRRHPGDAGYFGLPNYADTVRVPARDMLHLMIEERPNQVRGVPHLTATAILLHELHTYLDAEAVRKRVVAMIAGFIKKRPGDPDDPNVGGPVSQEDDGAAVVQWEPGTLADIGEDEIEFVQPADVGGNFDAYIKAQYRAVAASAGVLYEHVTGEYSDMNDRLYRGAILNYRREIQRLQQLVVVARFCQPVWERFVDTAILSGAYRVPEGVGVEDLYDVAWVPQGWDYIHPVQEIDAAQKAVAAGFKSRSEVIVQQGRDPDEVDAEQAADNERAAGFGLTYETTTAAAGGSKEGSDA